MQLAVQPPYHHQYRCYGGNYTCFSKRHNMHEGGRKIYRVEDLICIQVEQKLPVNIFRRHG